jgi:hypothetical protein
MFKFNYCILNTGNGGIIFLFSPNSYTALELIMKCYMALRAMKKH